MNVSAWATSVGASVPPVLGRGLLEGGDAAGDVEPAQGEQALDLEDDGRPVRLVDREHPGPAGVDERRPRGRGRCCATRGRWPPAPGRPPARTRSPASSARRSAFSARSSLAAMSSNAYWAWMAATSRRARGPGSRRSAWASSSSAHCQRLGAGRRVDPAQDEVLEQHGRPARCRPASSRRRSTERIVGSSATNRSMTATWSGPRAVDVELGGQRERTTRPGAGARVGSSSSPSRAAAWARTGCSRRQRSPLPARAARARRRRARGGPSGRGRRVDPGGAGGARGVERAGEHAEHVVEARARRGRAGHGGVEGGAAADRPPAPAGGVGVEHADAVVGQPAGEGVERFGAGGRRRDLDGERQPVERRDDRRRPSSQSPSATGDALLVEAPDEQRHGRRVSGRSSASARWAAATTSGARGTTASPAIPSGRRAGGEQAEPGRGPQQARRPWRPRPSRACSHPSSTIRAPRAAPGARPPGRAASPASAAGAPMAAASAVGNPSPPAGGQVDHDHAVGEVGRPTESATSTASAVFPTPPGPDDADHAVAAPAEPATAARSSSRPDQRWPAAPGGCRARAASGPRRGTGPAGGWRSRGRRSSWPGSSPVRSARTAAACR